MKSVTKSVKSAWLSSKLWRPKITFQIFFFQLYFIKKYVYVAINDFAKHLIISKWFRRQRYKQKRKIKKDVEAKEELSTKVFSFI